MTAPRWFWVASCVLVFNIALVVSSVVWRHVRADELGSGEPSSAQTPQSQVDKLPFPADFPAVPLPSDPESLKSDPVFQEFRRFFSGQGEQATSERANIATAEPTQSEAYFIALDQRLQTVEQLCSSARRLASAAARKSRDGSPKQSAELLQMATQLRDMAAKLLVGEP